MVVASAIHAQPHSVYIEDGVCLVCEIRVEQHKVLWVDQNEYPDFGALGLKECMFENGKTHHGPWYRYICLILTETEDTMDREAFEELYGD